MIEKVLPSSWDTRFFTFSKNATLGFLSDIILATSKNNVPLASSKPNCLPAKEKAWQGKPASKTSKSGNSDASIVVMSLTSTFILKFSSNVRAGYTSISLA